MRQLVSLVVLSATSFIVSAQTAPSDAPLMPSSTSTAVAETEATEAAADCAGLLTEAKNKQFLASAMVTEKRWSDALNTFVIAERATQTIISLCTGPEQSEAKLLLTKLSSQITQAGDQRQRIEFCRPAFDKALGLDLKAATARSQKLPIAELEVLYSHAEAAWKEAVSHCRGKDLARAQASLSDSAEAHAAIKVTGSSGSGCDDAWRNAESLVDLAKAAWTEKRWEDSGMLYRKAAMGWDVAEEQCESGERHEQAGKKRDSAEVDANNALHCAPRWNQARDVSQKFKLEGQALGSAERGQLSMQAEVAWRELAEHCQGGPRETAKANADGIARERGTPLTLTVNKAPPTRKTAPAAAPAVAANPTPAVAANPAAVAASAASDSAPAIAPVVATAAVPVARAVASVAAASAVVPVTAAAQPVATAAATTTLPAAPKPAPEPAPVKAAPELPSTVIKAGDVTYEGQFKVDGGAQTVTGSGTVRWSNGNTFTGNLVKSQETGKGKLTYANGQVYDGEWIDGKGTGNAEMLFPNGNKYAGKAVDGKPDGLGKMVSANGDVFEGMFKDGRFEGKGKFRWASGDTYDGEWANGKPHGRGEYIWSSGERAVGIYKDGVKVD